MDLKLSVCKSSIDQTSFQRGILVEIVFKILKALSKNIKTLVECQINWCSNNYSFFNVLREL